MPTQISKNQRSATSTVESSRTTAERLYIISRLAPTTDDRQRLNVNGDLRNPARGPYYNTGRPRAFLLMPFGHVCKQHEEDIDYAETEALHDKLMEIRGYFDSEFRLQMFGEKNAEKYEFVNR